MNTLQQALKSAAQRHGAPCVGTIKPHAKSFEALTFGGLDLNGNADVTFLKACDGKNVYYRLGSHAKTEMICAREFKADLDVMAEYAETWLPPTRDEYSAEWLDAIDRLEVAQTEVNMVEDAMYTVVLQERASTYSLVAGMAI